MGKWLGGFIIGIIFVLAAGFLFVYSGQMPVATHGSPLPMEKFIAHLALRKAIGDQADRPAPNKIDDAMLVVAAQNYRVDCAICHGLMGSEKSHVAQGLFPPPPALLPPHKGVTDDPIGETFWKVKNGIRLTGMPGFEKRLTENEIWAISQLLAKADQLPPTVVAELKEKK